jgi:hypothetical protein
MEQLDKPNYLKFRAKSLFVVDFYYFGLIEKVEQQDKRSYLMFHEKPLFVVDSPVVKHAQKDRQSYLMSRVIPLSVALDLLMLGQEQMDKKNCLKFHVTPLCVVD